MFRGVTDEISSHLRITQDGPIIFVPVQVFCLKLFCNILVPWVCGWRILRYLFYINMSACPESNLQRLVYYQQEKKEQRSQKKAYFRFFVERHKTWSFQKCKCSQTGRNFPHYLRFFSATNFLREIYFIFGSSTVWSGRFLSSILFSTWCYHSHRKYGPIMMCSLEIVGFSILDKI